MLLWCCRSVHLCEPCCRREHELVAIKRLQKLFPPAEEKSVENEIATTGALKSSRKKHKKLKKQHQEKKKMEESQIAQSPYKDLETMSYHPMGSSRVYAARSQLV
jgi:hypothetical protein